ncbi:hypothetical protein EJ02DRAFT_428776 [Clathrospora elynae]|uniref:Uncharacterized protein n=1 Tax=Clathrospora elynae TaxID=706981 RepID=A0A6A5S5N7_9PLEO|nr:hypothetical protein EJ02DRAFT_428776 [Clathrospora elynae]
MSDPNQKQSPLCLLVQQLQQELQNQHVEIQSLWSNLDALHIVVQILIQIVVQIVVQTVFQTVIQCYDPTQRAVLLHMSNQWERTKTDKRAVPHPH